MSLAEALVKQLGRQVDARGPEAIERLADEALEVLDDDERLAELPLGMGDWILAGRDEARAALGELRAGAPALGDVGRVAVTQAAAWIVDGNLTAAELEVISGLSYAERIERQKAEARGVLYARAERDRKVAAALDVLQAVGKHALAFLVVVIAAGARGGLAAGS